jgi:hypothetical protein
VVVTIVVVAVVAVPPVVRWFDAAGGYNPAHYEPKDGDREDWLRTRDFTRLTGVSRPAVFYLVLFLLLAVVWLPLAPRPGRRTPPR